MWWKPGGMIISRKGGTTVVDDVLSPDPGARTGDYDYLYADVTTQRALDAAWKRHVSELEGRYRDTRVWADYSVHDLRLPWTARQVQVVTAVLLGLVAAVSAAVVADVPWLAWLLTPGLAVVAGFAARDLWRRFGLWLVDDYRAR